MRVLNRGTLFFLVLIGFAFAVVAEIGSQSVRASNIVPVGGTSYPVNSYAPPVYTQPYAGNPYIYNQGVPYTYRSPYNYAPAYGSYGAPIPMLQPYGGSLYSATFGGCNLRLWRAQSGYYYPWVGGYGYNVYPIFVVPPGQTNPASTLPPLSTLVADLNDYLDKAKEKGKIDEPDFITLKRRASDLLSKEKALAYESGGLDQDQEADLRRDVDELSGEVARRVKP